MKLKGLMQIGKRLISRGDYRAPKLFKRVQAGGLLSVGAGIAERIASPEAKEVADQVISKTQGAIENGSELIQLMDQVKEVNDPVMSYILIIGGIVAVIVGRLPINGTMGPEGIMPKKND